MTAADGTIDAPAVIEAAPIGRFQIWVCVCCAMVLFVDGLNTQILGFILPQIAQAWGIPHEMLGIIFSSSLIGLFAGYLFIAPLSAQLGHKRVMVACTALFGVVTLATTLARDPYTLMAARFITGVGLGGALPSALAMTGEFIPGRRRSTAATLVISGISLGSTCAGVTAAMLLDAYGWQSVLIVGGLLPLVIALVLAFTLSESFSYLVMRRGDNAGALRLLARIDPAIGKGPATRTVTMGSESSSASVLMLFQDRRTVGTLAQWLMMVLNLLVNYALQNWLTTMLIQLGQTHRVAIAATTMINAGGILSGFVVGPLMDRFGVYRILTALFVAAAGFVFTVGSMLNGPVVALLASSFCLGLCSNGLQKGAGALAIFFYPTALRSTGTGWLFGVGRVGAILGPLAIGSLLAAGWTPARLLHTAVIPMLLGAAVVATMGLFYVRGPGRKR
jgi:AAHS family 4-hydroxybenzoate transporter-like MFS transporter